MMKTSEVDCGNGCKTTWIYLKPMNCTLKSVQAKTKKKKERKKEIKTACCGPQFGLRGWSCKGKKIA